MAPSILTPEHAALYLQLQSAHRRIEARFHTARDLWKAALKVKRSWKQGEYVALLRTTQRHLFDAKRFALEDPETHERYLKLIMVDNVIMEGPTDMGLTKAPKADDSHTLTSPGYIEYLIQKHLPPTEEMKPGD